MMSPPRSSNTLYVNHDTFDAHAPRRAIPILLPRRKSRCQVFEFEDLKVWGLGGLGKTTPDIFFTTRSPFSPVYQLAAFFTSITYYCSFLYTELELRSPRKHQLLRSLF